jgi:hypothetical protein
MRSLSRYLNLLFRLHTTNEDKVALYLAVHPWSCGQCFVCDCCCVGFLQNALEVGGPILLRSGAGAAGKPLWSVGQHFGIITGVRDLRVSLVLSRTFTSCGERNGTRDFGVDDFALSVSVLPAVSEAAWPHRTLNQRERRILSGAQASILSDREKWQTSGFVGRIRPSGSAMLFSRISTLARCKSHG